MKQKNIVFLIAGVLFLVLSFVVYSWDEPGEMPSVYNPPINTGTERQYKNGEIGATVFRDTDDTQMLYYLNLSGNSKVAGTITGADPIGNSDFATKKYVDNLLVDVEEEISLANVFYIEGTTNPVCPSDSIQILKPSADSVVCAKVGELLYGNEHTVSQCHLWGGEVVTVESDNKKICRLNAAVCPGSFVQYGNWSTTSPDTMSYTRTGRNEDPTTCSCTTGFHAWGNVAREGCQVNMGTRYRNGNSFFPYHFCEPSYGDWCGGMYRPTCTSAFDGRSSYLIPDGNCDFVCGLAIVDQIGCY